MDRYRLISVENRRRMAAEMAVWLCLRATVCIAVASTCTTTSSAAQVAAATYDMATYIFWGGTPIIGSEDDPELPTISVNEDYSGGIVNEFNSHNTFTVIKFDDLSEIATKANGGPDKFLTLSALSVPVPSVVGVSMAAEDITSSVAGYPLREGLENLFPGNPPGSPTDRLRWYMDHIKGDDPAYGGYIGGASHVGVFTVDEPGDYSIDVTAAVDAWIEGSVPNYGFGLWGVSGADPFVGELVDFASMHHEDPSAWPTLESLPVGVTQPGDFDTDGDVDGDDFLIWQTEFGSGHTNPRADADGDGDVDGDDFLIWQSNFGSAAGSAACGVSAPEPLGIAMALLLAAGLGFWRTRAGVRSVFCCSAGGPAARLS